MSGNSAEFGKGGGIFNHSGNLTLADSVVSGNTAGNSGGGVYSLNGSVSLLRSTVSRNTGLLCGGLFVEGGTLTLTGSTISKNTTTNNGGGLFLDNTQATATGSTFFSNSASLAGGGIFNKGMLTLTNCTFEQNIAEGGLGGGIENQFGELTLVDCTLHNNFSPRGGGGVDNSGTLAMTSCVVSGNQGGTNSGGGIQHEAGSLTLVDSVVSGNRADGGGGLYILGGTVSLTRTTVSDNYASQYGGGLFAQGSTLTLTDSTITGNQSKSQGGGLFLYDSRVTATRLTISENIAQVAGGGILNARTVTGTSASNPGSDGVDTEDPPGTLNLIDCTLSENLAQAGGGGGIANLHGSVTLANSTLSGNRSQAGGGIANSGRLTSTNVTLAANHSFGNSGGGLTNTGLAFLFNTLAAGNYIGNGLTHFGDIQGAVDASSANNLVAVGDAMTGITNGSQGNLVGSTAAPIDARLGDLSDNGGPTLTVALLPGSPARQAGSVALAVDPTTGQPLAFDQRGPGFPRTVDGKVDIGAFETQPLLAPTTLTVAAATGTYGGPTTLIATLTASGQGIAGQLVDFHLGSTDLGTATTNAHGVATLANVSLASFHAGLYTDEIEAAFAGSPHDSPSDGTASLTITPAMLTITARNATKVYGAANPALTASYSGFVNGDTPASLTTLPTLATTATAASHVGNYPIVALGAVDADYVMTYVPGVLTVMPATLTITANNQTASFGGAVPLLTASYAGLVNGDTPASLATAVQLGTTATSNSPAGRYPIVVSGASSPDYLILFVNGTVTVGAYIPPANPVAEAGGKYLTRLYGEVLNRGPEPLGISYWQRRWKAGEARSRINLSFANSRERRALVQAGRQPSIPLPIAFAHARHAALAGRLGSTSLPSGPLTPGHKARHHH